MPQSEAPSISKLPRHFFVSVFTAFVTVGTLMSMHVCAVLSDCEQPEHREYLQHPFSHAP